MIVVDANITAYFFIEGLYTALSLKLRELDGDWIVPAQWQHEFLNILTKYARRGGLSREECLETWRDALGMLDERIYDVDMEGAFDLALRHGLTSYDAEYMQLALSKGVPCITEDKEILKAFPQQALSLEAYLKINNEN